MCMYVLDGPWAVEPDDLLFEWRHLLSLIRLVSGPEQLVEILGRQWVGVKWTSRPSPTSAGLVAVQRQEEGDIHQSSHIWRV